MTIIFDPNTERIQKLATLYPKRIEELKQIFNKPSHIYIDYANVIHWAKKLKWHVNLKRLKQLLNSFSTVGVVRFYNGTFIGDQKSEKFNEEAEKLGYHVKTKAVKIMKLSIDVSSIPPNSPFILKNFIKRPLLQKLNIETVEYLNEKLKELNNQGVKYIEVRKCNFDVEIGRDMLLDYEQNNIENYILWSGDSDFADPVNQLLEDGKKVVIFATARRISVELGETKSLKFDIQKIRDFICSANELPQDVKSKL
ncbi:MAG: NYN domain-containing protein [Patescibacteria group bacterium]